MKKTAAILFTCFYLVSTIGLTVNYHFCSGELVSVSVLGKPKACCGQAGEDKGCCQNKQLTKRIQDGHKTPGFSSVPKISFRDLQLFSIKIPYALPLTGYLYNHGSSRIHGPPDDPIQTGVYLLTRSIRI